MMRKNIRLSTLMIPVLRAWERGYGASGFGIQLFIDSGNLSLTGGLGGSTFGSSCEVREIG